MASEQHTISLWDLKARETAELVGFAPSLAAAFRGRLQEFGFHPGEHVACQLMPGFGSPRVYQVSNATYSLDRELAELIQVKRLELPVHD